MDEKELKKLLDKELDKLAPSMSEKVKKAPILTKAEQREKSTQKIDISATRKRSAKPFVLGAIAAVLVIAIALAVILPPMFGDTVTPAPVYEAGYLRMDINPSVEIIYDKDNKVTAVKSANGDADVLLSDTLREELKGMTVEDAAAAIAEEAGKLGYIQPEQENAVRITVVAGSEKQQDEVASDVTAAIETNFMQKGVYVAVVAVKESADWLAEQYDTAAETLSESVNAVAAKADSYFEQLAAANHSSLEALKAYYEIEVFEYLRDLLEAECTKIGRIRELLHQAKEYNDKIIEHNKVFLFGADYWNTITSEDWKQDEELAVLVNGMTSTLAEIEELREDEIDSTILLETLVVTYDTFIDEEWISDIGNATLDELKGSFDEIISALEDLNIKITDAIRDAVALVPGSVQEFLDGTENVINGMRQELHEIYLDAYNASRDELSEEDYEGYYLRIISEYGSLEAYWQSLQD